MGPPAGLYFVQWLSYFKITIGRNFKRLQNFKIPNEIDIQISKSQSAEIETAANICNPKLTGGRRRQAGMDVSGAPVVYRRGNKFPILLLRHNLNNSEYVFHRKRLDGVVPVRIRPMGNYAVAMDWSDGHKASIYTYDTLDKLAQ